MSGLAKVFVVVNLFLSLLFFGTAATLFLTRQDLAAEIKAKDEAYRADRRDLEQRLKHQKAANALAQKAVETLRNSEAQLTQEKSNLQRDIETFKGQLTEAQSAARQAVVSLEQNSKSLEATQKRAEELERLNGEASKVRDDVLDRVDRETRRASALKRDLDRLNEELSQIKKEHTRLVDEFDAVALQLAVYEKNFGPVGAGAAPLDALVDRVDRDLKAVVLTVGPNQGVEMGDEFTVYRGASYVGQVRVVKLYGDLSGAVIIYEADGQQVRKGDRATTKIGNVAALSAK